MFYDTSITTTKTLNDIKRSLANALSSKYKIDDEEKVEAFLKIHGLSKSNFDFVSCIERIVSERIADVSIDSNANKNEKTIETINQECTAAVKKAVGFDYLYRQIKDLYGKAEAKRLTGEMLDLSIGLSDSTNILKPYCWALNATPVVTIGRDFGQLHSTPSKRVSSYVSALCETVHQLSSHLAGAIAVGTFFLDIAHLSLYREEVDLRELKTNKAYRKYVENEMQQFVHSVNHLSRSGVESPFTNLSVFDRVKLAVLVEDMGWYFPLDSLPINYPKDLETEEDKKQFAIEYIVDYIVEIQDIFLDFFDNGDPLKGGAPYRFPVVTINISKKKWGEREIIEDQKFLREVCKREIYRYNIFVSEGHKVASCCRLISNTEMMDYASQSNSFGAGGSLSLGSHRVCTINFMRIALEAKSKEQFFEILDQRVMDAGKILKAHKMLISTLEKQGLQPFITRGWIALSRLFSTFGMLGIYEASKVYKEKFGNGSDVEGEILTHFNQKVSEVSAELEIVGNIEQIPGESFAVRLATADKMIFGKKKVPYELYSNQFIPLWENATLWEKMDADGKYNRLVTGGGIVHAQIGEKVTAAQAEKIIKYAIASGAEHFALNSVYSQCSNGHSTFGKVEKCPECGDDINEWFTRVVGFFTPISSWHEVRREWEFPRRTFCELGEITQ